eukprot:208079_1
MSQRKPTKTGNAKKRKNKKHTSKPRQQHNKNKNKSIPQVHNCSALKCNLFHQMQPEIDDDFKHSHYEEPDYQKIRIDKNNEYKSYLKVLTNKLKTKMKLSEVIKIIEQNIKSIESQQDHMTPNMFDETLEIISTYNSSNIDENFFDDETKQQKTELANLHSDILSKIAKSYLSKSTHAHVDKTTPYFDHILSALNHCNIAIQINKNNMLAHFYQITCWLKLGLFKPAELKIKRMKSKFANQNHEIPKNFEKLFATGKICTLAKNMNMAVQKYQKVLLSKSKHHHPLNYFQCENGVQQFAWNAMYLAVASLVKNNKWTVYDVSEYFGHVYLLMLLAKRSEDTEFEEVMFQNGSIIIYTLSTICCWNVKQIIKCVTLFAKKDVYAFDKLSEFDKDAFGIFLSTFNQNKCAKSYKFNKHLCIEWAKLHNMTSPLVSDSLKSAARSKKQYMHEIWNQVYGASNVFAEYSDYTPELNGFLLIHATASMFSPDALKEIEGMNTLLDLNLRERNVSFLHYLALNGCVETVQLLVKHGMNVNYIMNRDCEFKSEFSAKYNEVIGKSPLTPLDFCFYGMDVLTNNNENEVN